MDRPGSTPIDSPGTKNSSTSTSTSTSTATTATTNTTASVKPDGVSIKVERDQSRDLNSRRAAACLVCRRSKIKCEKGRAAVHNDDRCQRCTQLGVQCVRPDFHVGRRKGVKKHVSFFFVLIHL